MYAINLLRCFKSFHLPSCLEIRSNLVENCGSRAACLRPLLLTEASAKLQIINRIAH